MSSNKSTTSTSSASSTSSVTSGGKNKNRRQTIAALAAAAATVTASGTGLPSAANTNPTDLQRNLAALASQFGLKDTSNFDQIIHDMNVNNEKSKLLLTHTPQPANPIKHSKKHHLLAAQSANNSPNLSQNNGPKVPRVKGKKSQQHFQDSSNLLQPSAGAPMPAAATNAVAAAAAAALRYHQLLNQANNNNNANVNGAFNSNTPQKPVVPKYMVPSGGNNYYPNADDMEDENNRNRRYEDDDDEEYIKGENYDEEDMLMNKEANSQNVAMSMQQQQAFGTAGSINFKSLNNVSSGKQEPLTQSNNQANLTMTPNLEFECTACEKKFKYYCYYKRHMDACHSDNPKYVCDTCNKSYKWEASFRQHLRSHHTNGDLPNENQPKTDGEMYGIQMAGFGGDNHRREYADENEEELMERENKNNESSSEMREGNECQGDEGSDTEDNDDDYDDIDSQEQDIEQQINRSQQGEPKHQSHLHLIGERDTEQMGAAGALASIADSINSMIQHNVASLATSN